MKGKATHTKTSKTENSTKAYSVLVNEIDDLLKIAYYQGESNPQLSSKSVEKALNKSYELSYEKGILKGLYCRIRASVSEGNYDKCIVDYNTIIATNNYDLILNKTEVAEINRFIAFAFSFKNEFELSLDCGNIALEIYEEESDIYGIAKVNNLLGAVYYLQANYKESYISYKVAAEQLEQKQNKTLKELEELSISYRNLGLLFSHFEDFEQAEYFIEKSIPLSKECKNIRLSSSFMYCLADCYNLSKKYKQALDLTIKATAICSVSKYPGTYISILMVQVHSLYYLGKYNQAYDVAIQCIVLCKKHEILINNYWSTQCILCACLLKLNEFEKAIELYNSFKDKVSEAHFKSQDVLYHELRKYFEEIEDYKNAYKIASKYIRFREKVDGIKRDARLQRLAIEHKVKEKEKEISLQKNLLNKEIEFKRILEQEYKNQRDFLNILAHDLKAPIRTIKNFSHLALKSNEIDKTTEYLQFVNTGVNNMQSFVDDLLSFAKSGKIDKAPQQIDLNNIIVRVKANLSSDFTEKKGTLIIEKKLPIIWANETPMIQLFQNIIGNSLKYCKPNQAPQIIVRFFELSDYYKIAIEDNGQGIPKNMLTEIFEPFKRNHSSKEVKGHGLGLASCKKIIESYKGQLWVTSELGIGSTFTFTFPQNKNS